MLLLILLIISVMNFLPGVQIVQDSSVSVLLDEAMNGKKEMVEADGFRVQIYSSNNPQEAKKEALEMESEWKDKLTQPLYVQYVAPFWKVRVGNFRTTTEAKEYRKILIEQYPEFKGATYVVPDKIQIMQ